MMDPRDFVKLLFETYDKSAVVDFREFLKTNVGVKKWQIAADFCLDDKERPNDTFAFTLIPYDAYPDDLISEIRRALPKDLKKTKTISGAASEFLRQDRRFHFAFLFPEP